MRTPRPGVVSTIIPVRNRAALVGEAVSSVLAQTYRPIEVVVVDDGSTDDTRAAIAALAGAYPAEVTALFREHEGIAQARNAGLEVASGEFIQFLDSDDLLMPGKFAAQVTSLAARPDGGVSYGLTREYAIGQAWSGRPARRTGERFDALFPALVDGRIWPAPTPLYRRSVVEANGPFLPLRIYEDWEYECRAAARGVKPVHVGEWLADKRDVHAREGRRKGGVTPDTVSDYAEAHTRILAHARRAGAGDLDRFAGRLFRVARLCADAGAEADARRCLSLAFEVASSRRRAAIAAYRSVSAALGWQVVGGWSTAFGDNRVRRVRA